MLTLIEELADVAWTGMDCVEVAPAYDHAELTTNAAAAIVWTYLSGQVARTAAATAPCSPVHRDLARGDGPG
ncbi:MAG: hypothetical protein NVS3B7_16430 [Candidatus Elarobacter sp.]